MAEEEKGFIIKDHRSFDEGGELKKERPAEESPPPNKPGEKKTQPRPEEEQRTPLPEVNFSTLIFSLSSSALLHLGEITDPATGQKITDLALAKHSIDIIAMLQEKTKGNLNAEEQKFLESILTDLRWRFVKASR